MKSLYKNRPAGWDVKARRLVLEIKETDGGRYIVGYAATFEQPQNHDDYGDIINPKAFDAFVAAHKAGRASVKMLAHHDMDKPIGIWQEFRVDQKGLYAIGKVTEGVRDGDEVLRLIGDGVIDSLSIGYITKNSRFIDVKTSWGAQVRELLEIEPKEVSPVTFPANEYAKIMEVRSARTLEFEQKAFRQSLDNFDLYLSTVNARVKAL